MGSAFRQLQDGQFVSCQLIAPTPERPFYHFPAACRHFAHADWKSGGGDTILLRIRYKNSEQNIERQIVHRLPIAKDPRTGTCKKSAAVLCAGSNVYVTRIDLEDDEFECSYIRGAERASQ